MLLVAFTLNMKVIVVKAKDNQLENISMRSDHTGVT